MKTPSEYSQISEAAFTAQVIALARWMGWRCAHFRPAMTKRGRWVTAVQGDGAGFPDLVLVRHKDSRLIFAELKAAKGKLSDAQKLWLAALDSLTENTEEVGTKIECYCWRPADIEQIERILA